MNLEKLNPWNWFKHEEGPRPSEDQVPMSREEYLQRAPHSSAGPLRRDVDRLLEDTFRGLGIPSLLGRTSAGSDLAAGFFPKVDVASDDEQYIITLEAAGLSDDDVEISLQDKRLIVSGEKKDEKTERDRRYYRIERSYGSFQRVLALPDDANAEDAKASMNHGVLKITIPRSQEKASGGKTIPIGKG